MFEWLFGNNKVKKEVEKVKEETKKGFDSVKNDIDSVSKWIQHLDSQDDLLKQQILDVKEDLSTIKDDLEGLKNLVSFFDSQLSKQLFKRKKSTDRQLSSKQTPVEGVQIPVQTAVQTAILDDFSMNEKAMVWILVNSDMKLSYDDLAAMLGKQRSTVRTQVNNMKQKSEGLIEEIIEKNGKKRLYVPEKMKDLLLKSAKVRIRKQRKSKKKRR